jgi:type VI secretion system protein ImpK
MADDDPFTDSDDIERTVIKPTPGGRRYAGAPREAEATQQRRQPGRPALPVHGGGNRLVNAATTALTLLKQLRNSASHGDVPGLRAHMIDEIRTFEGTAQRLGVDAATVADACYALCAVIDEAVLNTPWGGQSVWSAQSLLSTLHNETFGGEKFFQILNERGQDPARNVDLLELLYICLALGFQGRFRIMERGDAKLEELRQNLYRAIRAARGEHERELSPRWQGATDSGPRLARYVPFWVVGVVACGLILAIYAGFSFALNSSSDAAYADLNALGRDIPVVLPSREPVAVVVPEVQTAGKFDRIRAQLEGEIGQGLLDVIDGPGGITIRIFNKRMFGSGNASVDSEYEALIDKIGGLLDEESGKLLVIGHTDDQPISTLRFPSNWHLSVARANSVAAVLSQSISAPERINVEGHADSEPIATNDTAEGRNMNRRIEIMIGHGAGSSS